jgi:hypothetical protein
MQTRREVRNIMGHDTVNAAKHRAHEAHPELAGESDEDRHARLQAHLPRLCAWINVRHREGRFAGDRQLQLRAWARNHVHRFSLDVAEDHEAMSRGQVSHTVFIAVLADDAVEASLLAAQMASRHGIATAVHPLIT